MKTFLKENWYKMLIGTSVFIASSALLIHSISPAQAGNINDLRNKALNDFKTNTSAGAEGKIMMSPMTVNVTKSGNTYYSVLVWDTETGRSKLYSTKLAAGGSMKPEEANMQLPSNPL